MNLMNSKNMKNLKNSKLIDLKEEVNFPVGNFEFTPSANTKVITN